MSANMTDSQLQKTIEAAKTDLNQGVAHSVPTGQEAMPPMKQDPIALRKAMFKKADEQRAMESGVPVDATAQDQIDHMSARPQDANPGDTQNIRQRLNQEQRQVQQPDIQQVQQVDPNEIVPLQVGNTTIKVTRADIERAGGADLYLRRRQMDDEALEMHKERQKLEAARQEFERRLAESQKWSNRTGVEPVPGQGQDPANLVADPATTVTPGARGVDIDSLSQEIAEQLYSGDSESAAKSVKRILSYAMARGDTLSVDEIAAKVKAQIETKPSASAPAAPPVNPVIEAVNAQLNSMAQAEFPDLLKDDVARSAAWAKFQGMVKLPENADRRAVDVARDACQWAEDTLRNPRGKVIEQKRGLQPTNAAATVGAMVDAEPDRQTASDAVSTIASFRQFGRRPK